LAQAVNHPSVARDDIIMLFRVSIGSREFPTLLPEQAVDFDVPKSARRGELTPGWNFPPPPLPMMTTRFTSGLSVSSRMLSIRAENAAQARTVKRQEPISVAKSDRPLLIR
jgi:hypothetical protein